MEYVTGGDIIDRVGMEYVRDRDIIVRADNDLILILSVLADVPANQLTRYHFAFQDNRVGESGRFFRKDEARTSDKTS